MRLFMLDTNMVSYIVRDWSPAANARLLALKGDEIATLSIITEAEIRYGLARKPQATVLKGLMEGFLARIPGMVWGRDEARAYGRVKAKLETRGVTLAGMDMMIAAHAIATEAILVTNDKVFSQVDDLIGIENWATDL